MIKKQLYMINFNWRTKLKTNKNFIKWIRTKIKNKKNKDKIEKKSKPCTFSGRRLKRRKKRNDHRH